jgi:hypothetical protein
LRGLRDTWLSACVGLIDLKAVHEAIEEALNANDWPSSAQFVEFEACDTQL